MDLLVVIDRDQAREIVRRVDTAVGIDPTFAVSADDLTETRLSIEQVAERVGPMELSLDLRVLAYKLGPLQDV